jgi:hypothetical protein
METNVSERMNGKDQNKKRKVRYGNIKTRANIVIIFILDWLWLFKQ